ncbi:helix-turn-helix transcriptional regulator [Brevibacterium litoralis]|uniref:helix-turn-helix transcriptional regulator n=1 Tax=Brevibacterium litoralis TaxID=3138935 RepID=UPI0032EAA2DC
MRPRIRSAWTAPAVTVLKDAGPVLLAEAVRAAAAGDALISPRITTRLLETFAGRDPAEAGRSRAREPFEPLSPREEDVVRLLARGLTNTEICAELHLSLGTVKTHIGGILTKIGLRNRVEAAMWVHETGRVSSA